MRHDCEFCEYRHSKCSYTIDNIPEDNCPEFVVGRCFSCQLNGSNDGYCISHQMALNWCGCDKYIKMN